MPKFIYLLILLCCGIGVASASNGTDYVFSTPTDKLTARQSSVYHIGQDQFGFMWLATDSDGLLRFDGTESINWLATGKETQYRQNVNKFVLDDNGAMWFASWGHGLTYISASQQLQLHFRADETNPDALASDRVQTLFMDRKRRLWVGSVAGVNYIDSSNRNQIKRFSSDDPSHPLYQSRIWWITESADGIWFATSDGIVLLPADQSAAKHYYLPLSSSLQLERAREVRALQQFDSGLWASSANGIYRYNSACDCFKQVTMPTTMATPRFNVVHPQGDNLLWVGAAEGLFLLDTQTLSWVMKDNNYNFLPDVDVRTLFVNAANQLWVGSRDQGLFIGTPQHRVFSPLATKLPPAKSQAASRLTSVLFHDHADKLWLVAQDTLLYQDSDGSWQQFPFRAKANIQKIYQIAEYPAGTLWLATDTGLYQFKDGKLQFEPTPFQLTDLAPSGVTALHVDPKGVMYLGIWQRGLISWQLNTDKASLDLIQLADNSGDQIYDLTLSPEGVLFAATRYSGLFKLTPTQGWLSVDTGTREFVEGFNCVVPESVSRLWLCSEYGLWFVDLENGQQQHYLTEHGLPSVYITAALFDKQGHLWSLTNHGPARFDQQMQRFISYGTNDGLPDLTLQRNAHSVAADGTLYLGTASGTVLSKFDPSTERLSAPTVNLSKVLIDGVNYTIEYSGEVSTINLPADYRELVLGFSVLDYREPEKNTIRYRLLGLSSNWTNASRNRELRYVNLPAGQYQLEVEGQNSQGIASARPLLISIEVAAPWWHSPLLWIGGILLLLLSIGSFIYWRELSLKRRNAKLALLVTERTQALETLTQQLKQRAEHDSLTGLLNRAGFNEHFNRLRSQACRQSIPLSIVLIDLDHFKRLNDQYGHAAGDLALQHFSSLLQQRLRDSDLCGRWGGEEFILALGNCDASGAKRFCEDLLIVLQQHPFTYQDKPLSISATFGIAQLATSTGSLEQWVRLADQALYQGKEQGRGCAVIANTN
jgi:diguanylate cyclase (GGDEF)-like protein